MLSILLTVLLVLVIVGGALYILSIAPLDPTIKQIGRVIIILGLVICAILWLMDFLGVVSFGHHLVR